MKPCYVVFASTLTITAAAAALTFPGDARGQDRAAPLAADRFALPDVLAEDGRAGEPAAGEAVDVDTSYLWAAFEAGDYVSVREELQVLQRLHPGWSPPAELVQLTDAQQSREIVLPAVEAGAHADAVAYYEAHPGRFACAEVTIESLWAVAEAYAALDRPDDAFGVYRRVLDECEETDLRLATLEKAIARQDPGRLKGLVAIEQQRDHDDAERERLARIRADGLGGGTGPVALSRLDRTLAAVGTGRASPDDVAWLADHARAQRDANAAMVVGYHHLDADRAARARAWFERSLDWRRTDDALEGLYHALGELGLEDERRRLAARHPDALASVAAADAGDAQLAKAWRALEEGDTERALIYADVAGEDADPGERELVRGWALLAEDRPGDAEAAFARAAASGRAADRASAQKGRALAKVAAGRTDEVEIDDSLGDADVAEIERAKLERRITETFEAGDAERAHALLEGRRRRFPEAPAMGTLEGWILYELGELYAADQFFTELWVETRSEDARFALSTVREAMYPNR